MHFLEAIDGGNHDIRLHTMPSNEFIRQVNNVYWLMNNVSFSNTILTLTPSYLESKNWERIVRQPIPPKNYKLVGVGDMVKFGALIKDRNKKDQPWRYSILYNELIKEDYYKLFWVCVPIRGTYEWAMKALDYSLKVCCPLFSSQAYWYKDNDVILVKDCAHVNTNKVVYFREEKYKNCIDWKIYEIPEIGTFGWAEVQMNNNIVVTRKPWKNDFKAYKRNGFTKIVCGTMEYDDVKITDEDRLSTDWVIYKEAVKLKEELAEDILIYIGKIVEEKKWTILNIVELEKLYNKYLKAD